MSFSCTIKVSGRDVPEKVLHHQLLGLAPYGYESTSAPHRLSDFRELIAGSCRYGALTGDAAKGLIKDLQIMAQENLDSLNPCHCDTCHCDTCPPVEPIGWSIPQVERFLGIDPELVTYTRGGW